MVVVMMVTKVPRESFQSVDDIEGGHFLSINLMEYIFMIDYIVIYMTCKQRSWFGEESDSTNESFISNLVDSSRGTSKLWNPIQISGQRFYA